MDTNAARRIDVYDGTDHIGTLFEQDRTFRAEDADGVALGSFSDREAAMSAITAHHRAGAWRHVGKVADRVLDRLDPDRGD